MKKLFAFALAASSIALVSAPAMAIPANHPFKVELDFFDGAQEDVSVGTIEILGTVFFSTSASGEEACRLIAKWLVTPGTGAKSKTTNLFLDEDQIDGLNDCDANARVWQDTAVELATPLSDPPAALGTSSGFDASFTKQTIVHLLAGESGEGENNVTGKIRFGNGSTVSFEFEP